MEFSLHRVWLLCKKQWTENWLLYALSLAVTAGLMAIWLLYVLVSSKYGINKNIQVDGMFGGWMIAGSIFSATILSNFNDKIKGIQALTLPASELEKMFAALLLVFGIFPLAYLAVVYPIICIVHLIDVGPFGKLNPLYHFEGFFTNGAITIILVLHSAVSLFSIVFRRYTVLKTAVVMIGTFIFIISFNNLLVKAMIDIPKGPPMLNTSGELSPDQWDKSTYITANVRRIAYGPKGEVLADGKIKKYIAGEITSNSPFSKISISSSLETQNYRYLKNGFNMPEGLSYSTYTYLTLDKNTDRIFSKLVYLLVPLLWLITWFRLKETQL